MSHKETEEQPLRKQSLGVDMLNGPLFKKIVLFALPLAASSILQQLFNAADIAVVGRFASSQAMAAVGSNGAIINLIISLFMGLSVGANVLISVLIGQNKRERIPDAVSTSISVALISGIGLAVIGFFLARPILELISTPEDVLDLAVLYLRIYFCGMPVVMLYNFGAAILRSMGDSRRPLIALAAAGVINVLLNLLLVAVFRLHVIGVGAATVISNAVSAGMTLVFLVREEGPFHLDLQRLRINRRDLIKLLTIGLPAGLQGMVFSISNTVIQAAINSFGSAASAGSAAAVNYESLSYLGVNAFNQAAVTFTSQNYAAGKFDRCRRVYRISILSALFSAFTLDMFFILTRNISLQLFTTDPAVLSYAVQRVEFILAVQWMICSYEITGSVLRGMGYSMTPSVLMIFGTCIFRLFWVSVVFPRFRSFITVLAVYPASWLLTGSLLFAAYFLVRKKAFTRGATLKV